MKRLERADALLLETLGYAVRFEGSEGRNVAEVVDGNGVVVDRESASTGEQDACDRLMVRVRERAAAAGIV